MARSISVERLQKTLYFLFVAIAAFAMDQATKQAIVENFRLHESIKIIPGFLHLTYIRNTGAAFGILSGPEHWRLYFFLVAGTLAMVFLFRFFYSNYREPLIVIGTGLVCGGAAGNISDRIRLGYVVDFLDFSVKGHHWPAFNISDSAITVGVFLILIHFLSDRTG